MSLTITGLAKQTSIYGVFQLLQKGLALAIIPLYTHYLSPEQYGTLDILYLIVWFVGIIGASKLDAAFVRYYAGAVQSGTVQELLSSSVTMLLIFATALCAIGALAADPILRFMFSGKTLPYTGYYLALAATWLEIVGSMPLAYLRARHEAKLVGIISLTQAVAGTLTGLIWVVGFGGDFHALLAGLVVSGAALTLLAYGALLRRSTIMVDFRYVKQLLKWALPMVPAPVFMYLLNYADRYFLLRYAGLAEVGIYAMAYKFAMLPYLLIMSPFGEMWGPNQFALYEAGQKQTYQRIALLYVSLVYLAALGVIYFSFEVTHLAFDARYYRLLTVVAPLTLGIAIWGVVPTLDLGFQIRDKTWIRSVTTGIAAGTNALLNWLLIPSMGMMGAALATLLSFALLAIVTHLANAALTDYSIPTGKAMQLTVALCIASGLLYLGPHMSYAVFLPLRVIAVLGFIVYLLRVNDVRPGEILPLLRRRGA